MGEVMRRVQQEPNLSEAGTCCLAFCGVGIVESALSVPCLQQILYFAQITPRVSTLVGREMGNPCCDCIITTFCFPCRVTQEELEMRKMAEQGRTDLYLKGSMVSCCCTADHGSVSHLAPAAGAKGSGV